MGFKQALFLGGAVLVLAACSDATGPEAAMRKGGSAASVKRAPDTTSVLPDATNQATSLDGCRWGYLVSQPFYCPSGR